MRSIILNGYQWSSLGIGYGYTIVQNQIGQNKRGDLFCFVAYIEKGSFVMSNHIRSSNHHMAWADGQVDDLLEAGFADEQIDLSERYKEIEALRVAEDRLAQANHAVDVHLGGLEHLRDFFKIKVGDNKFVHIQKKYKSHPRAEGPMKYWVLDDSDMLVGEIFDSLASLKNAIDSLVDTEC